MITFSLPFPPAANNLFVNGAAGRFISPRYKAWRSDAGWMVPRTAKGAVPGHFRAVLTFDRPDRRKRDLDNLLKAPMDLLKTMGVIMDDRLAERLTTEWATPFTAPIFPPIPMVKIAIEPLTEANP